MNYTEQKNRLIVKREELLHEYDILFTKVQKFNNRLLDLLNSDDLTKEEKNNLLNFTVKDPNMLKIIRLICSLEYVEEPENRRKFNNLQKNMSLYTKKYKTKK